jgi:hypothetical protein
MKNFTIENETNNITVHGSAKEAEAFPDSERFGTEAALAKLAANWPAARLIYIWNSLPGASPVRKFKDRATAVSRIWKAIQSAGQAEAVAAGEASPESAQPEAVIPESPVPDAATPVAPHAPDVASELASAKTKTARAMKVPQSATDPGAPREGSKTSQVIAMLKRDGGTTLEEIMSAMDWLKHTARAMLSAGGSLRKKHGVIVTSEKVGDRRRYSIKG